MNVVCETCEQVYDETYHLTYCPHAYFPMRTRAVRPDGTERVCTTLEELDQFLHGDGGHGA